MLTAAIGCGKGEVKLFTLNVGTCHLDAHGIAKLIDMSAAPPYKTLVLLVEVVVVVVEVSHRHKAFAVVVVYLAVNAVALYAADMSVILLS